MNADSHVKDLPLQFRTAYMGMSFDESREAQGMIPAFNQSGIIPPYINPDGPGASSTDMTPFRATAEEFVQRFLTTTQRQALLGKWLAHREAMRKVGITNGTQWLDGSFVEDKFPKDVDVVTYFHRPKNQTGRPINHLEMLQLMQGNSSLFRRDLAKATYSLDAFFIDLDANAKNLVNLTRYFCGLFSHQRTTDLWKGMLEIDLLDLTEASAVKSVREWVAP